MAVNNPSRTRPRISRRIQIGVSLIEVLVSIFIIAVSLLGLAGMQARATNAEFESYQRSQAIMLANDMVERIRMNRKDSGSFKNINGFLGTTGTGAFSLTCPGSTQVEKDMCAWQDLLIGSAETSGGSKVGAMIGARGCITYDASTEYSGIADTGVFTVSVVWQGTQDTVPPSISCASGLYGTESKRRLISMPFRLGYLK